MTGFSSWQQLNTSTTFIARETPGSSRWRACGRKYRSSTRPSLTANNSFLPLGHPSQDRCRRERERERERERGGGAAQVKRDKEASCLYISIADQVYVLLPQQRFEENRQWFRDYIQTRTQQNYKFWIVSSYVCGDHMPPTHHPHHAHIQVYHY